MGKIDNSIGSAALSSSLGVVGGLVNAFTSARQAKKNREFAERMSKQQNQFNHDEAELAYRRTVEQWNRENEYNLPSAQFQRMLDAGINPYQAVSNIDGGNSTSAGASPAASSAGMPSIQNAYSNPTESFMQGTQGMLDNALKTLSATENSATLAGRVDNANSLNSENLIKLRSLAAESGFEAQVAENVYNKTLNQFKLVGASEEACARLTNIVSQAAIAFENSRQAGMNTDMLKIQRSQFQTRIFEEIDLLHNQNALTRQQFRFLKKQTDYYLTFAESQVKLNNAQATNQYAQASYTDLLRQWYPTIQQATLAHIWAQARQADSTTRFNNAHVGLLNTQIDSLLSNPRVRHYKNSFFNPKHKVTLGNFVPTLMSTWYTGMTDQSDLFGPYVPKFKF